MGDFAILYNQHLHRDEMLAELRRRGIPFEVKGVDLLTTPELRDAVAALRVLDVSDPVALFRLAALPQFGINPETFRAELALAGRNPSMEAVLEKVPGGMGLLVPLRAGRKELIAANSSLETALNLAQSVFELPESKPWQRLRQFCQCWRAKPKQIVGDGTLHDFLEYLEYFQEAGGSLTEDGEDEDVVAALGPRELEPAVPSRGGAVDDRARRQGAGISLRLCAAAEFEFVSEELSRNPGGISAGTARPREQGRGRSQDTCTKKSSGGCSMWRSRAPWTTCTSAAKARDSKNPFQTKYLQELNRASKVLEDAFEVADGAGLALHGTIQAAAAEPLPAVAQWVGLPPRPEARLCELSASAIDRYKRCPLAFKLSRDWRIPEEPAAPMQYGSAMHTALKAYFDGVRVGRPPDEAAVIACFVDQFEQAKVDDEYQRNLYLAKGREELTRLLQLGTGPSRRRDRGNGAPFQRADRRCYRDRPHGPAGPRRRRRGHHRRLQDWESQDAGRCRRQPATFDLRVSGGTTPHEAGPGGRSSTWRTLRCGGVAADRG